MTSICHLTVLEASADGAGRRHSVAIALNSLATDRVTGAATVMRGTAIGGGGAAAGRGGAAVEAERAGGSIVLRKEKRVT